MLVAVDLGNSRVKFAAFDGERIVARETIEGGGDGATLASGVIPFAPAFVADEVVVVSSAPRATEALLAALGRPARVLGNDVQAALDTSYSRPEDLGLDRLAAAFGARALVGGGAVVVVDAGTALTVDAVTADGQFLAVAIAPGLWTAARGLRGAAPHLPPVRVRGKSVVPATTTEESLRNGFGAGWAGLVGTLVSRALALTTETATVVLTGGEAELLAPLLAGDLRHEPDAVLHGVRALHCAVPA